MAAPRPHSGTRLHKPAAARPPLPARELMGRRLVLMRCMLTEAPQRFETDADFNRRIADEIERQARPLLEDCETLKGGGTGPGVSHE